ncbi:flagellar basal body rod protein FlgB [Bacillaceae bacterium]
MPSSLEILQKSLEAAALRQRTIANNIANVSTPHYKRQEVVFESLLKEALEKRSAFVGRRTHPRHLLIGNAPETLPSANVVTETNTVMQNNGNNVDIDAEMSQLAKNSLWYNALVTQLNHELGQLRLAITGRR